jgi:hypothetical protein
MNAADILWNNLPLIIVVYALAAVGIWTKVSDRHQK